MLNTLPKQSQFCSSSRLMSLKWMFGKFESIGNQSSDLMFVWILEGPGGVNKRRQQNKTTVYIQFQC